MDGIKRKIYRAKNANPVNRLIQLEDLQEIFQKVELNNVKVNDLDLFQRAFVHISYTNPTPKDLAEIDPNSDYNASLIEKEDTSLPFQKLSYESHEFLGDSILNTVVVAYIHKRYRKDKEHNEAFLTDLKHKLIRGTFLCVLAKKLDFQEFIILSSYFENINYRTKDSILEDVFEAFIGALYIDQGEGGKAYDYCHHLIIYLIEKYIDLAEVIKRRDNYKTLLNIHYQTTYNGYEPSYRLLSTQGMHGNETFKVGLLNMDGNVIAVGEGKRQLDAEQEAAKNALIKEGVDVYTDDDTPLRVVYDD